jgi:hypothetical protein
LLCHVDAASALTRRRGMAMGIELNRSKVAAMAME